MPNDDELARLDAETVRRLYAENILLREATDHVGSGNRLFRQQRPLEDRLTALGENSEREFLPLLTHPSPAVRLAAAYGVKPFDRPLFIKTLEALTGEYGNVGMDARLALRWAQEEADQPPSPPVTSPVTAPIEPRPPFLDWQKENPPPPAMSRGQLEDLLRTEYPTALAERVLALVRPAMGLWPQQKSVADTPFQTRLDGRPWAPRGWQWPLFAEEPMYFLGQIHCPDLAGMPGAELLPATGLLAFFGDFDAISGCFPAGDPSQGAVYHWTETELFPTEPPLPLDEEIVEPTPCALRLGLSLPHPFSKAIDALHMSKPEHQTYWDIYEKLKNHGVPEKAVWACDLDSKLLGWPYLVQDDFTSVLQTGRNAYRQLVELPARLGPGGSLYFLATDTDLAERRFERAVLEAQNT